MSAVTAMPELIVEAAEQLASVGSSVRAAHLTAAPATIAVLPAAADEVSTAVAHVFSRSAQGYHAMAGQAATFHEQFVRNLTASATSYASAEAANVGLLQRLDALGALPIRALTLFGGAQSQLLDLIDTLRHQLLTVLTGLFGVFIAILFILFIVAVVLLQAVNLTLNPEG